MLRVGLQMDPLDRIKVRSDSTFVLGLGAQERGHKLFHFLPAAVTWREGKVIAVAHPVTLRREDGNHFTFGPPVTLDLASDLDIVLLRQDPPFDTGYITNTHLLELAMRGGKLRVVNDPAGVRNAPEKTLILDFPRFLPPTLVSSDAQEIEAFAARHNNDVVAKKLYGNEGRDVYRYNGDTKGLLYFAVSHYEATHEPIQIQPFLPEIVDGDKRIVLIDGEVAGVIRRVPQKGDFRANLALGGTPYKCELSSEDKAICAALAPEFKKRGLYLVGIDVIGGKLIEINVTSPTGVVTINSLYGLTGDARLEMKFWQGLDRT